MSCAGHIDVGDGDLNARDQLRNQGTDRDMRCSLGCRVYSFGSRQTSLVNTAMEFQRQKLLGFLIN
jgi:hypothetical protein